MKSLIETKKEELNSIDENIINNINIFIEKSEEYNKLEEFKGLLISKDNEISKLNDINTSKENEIKRLNNLIEEIKKGTDTQKLEENFKKEKEQLLSKINNLELKIYNLKEEKEKEKEKLNTEENIINKEETFEEENKEKNNKLSYEELMKIKEDIEQKNQELVVEIKLLKDIQEPNEVSNEENMKKIEELQNKILEYETGKIIPELTRKKLDETQSQISKLINENKLLNEKVNSKSINKKEFETIIFKQENRILDLNALIKKKDFELLSKDNIANKNQVYSVQLLNIIKEQKIKIEKLKKQNKEEEKAQILELKREINNLENILELKETMILNMKNKYKNLQDKYLKMTFNIKRKEQDFLLNQAKMLKNKKFERNKQLYPKKNISNLFNEKIGALTTEDSNNLSDNRYQNVNTSSNNILNKKNQNKLYENEIKNSNDIILPVINTNNSENLDNDKDLVITGEKNKLEEINEMMQKVIENEHNNDN